MSEIRIRKRGNTYSYSFNISNLQDLRPRDVAAWVQELANKGFAAGTIMQAKSVLSAALKYAVYPVELIAINPATNIPIPRSAPRKVIKRMIITPEQFAAIPKATPCYPAIKIMYHTGMRISETLGLTWEDIDLNTGKICVSRQRFEAGYFDTPKTESSARVFYVDASFVSYLRMLRAEQAEHQMRFGQAYQLAYEDSRDDRALVLLPKKLPAPEYLPSCAVRSSVSVRMVSRSITPPSRLFCESQGSIRTASVIPMQRCRQMLLAFF